MEYGVVSGKLPWTADDRISLKALNYRDVFNLPRIDGLIVEFRVGSGATLRTFADMIGDHKIFGFDWFQGLPEDWNQTFTKGSLANPNYASLDWPSNSELVIGLIKDTLKPGTILHFDEIKNYQGCDHEIRAFNEYLEASGTSWNIAGQVTGPDGVFVMVS